MERFGFSFYSSQDSITRLSAAGILTRSADMLAVFERGTNLRKLQRALDASLALESFVLGVMRGESELFDINLKDINGRAQAAGCASASVKRIASVLRNLKRTGIIGKLQHTPHTAYVRIQRGEQFAEHQASYSRKLELSRLIAEKLFGDALRQSEMGLLAAGISPLGNAAPEHPEHEKPLTAAFSTAGILEAARRRGMAGDQGDMPAVREIENTLLWLSDMGVMRLQGGFMVIYHGMTIQRKVMDNKRRYRADDYRMLDEYYKQKLQQIHIVGEYANLMMSDYSAALAYVHDYFTMDYEKFIRKYFGEDRREELRRSMTAKQYQKLFAGLSDRQLEIIGSRARRIAVAAGPGSGKTMVLVHKLAALLLMEDVRPEHLLMLTFSRAAASEFRKRLFALIGAKAGFVDIKTFHSYAFDALGRLGSLEDSGDILGQAVEAIAGNTAVSGKAAKSTLVIDEAQDMSPGEYALVEALIAHNEEMRIIAVGDDDQNIYAFRGSDSRHLRMLAAEPGAVTFEMCENWRSARAIVALATRWVETLCGRMKHFPGAAQRDEEGQVTVTFCSKPGWLTSAAESLAAAAAEGRIEGSTALLAVSNEEALQAACLLSRRGIETRIVEGQQGVRLADLVEIRGLLSFIERRLGGSPIVSDELWKGAEAYLEKAFGDSIWQPGVKRLMKAFLALNGSRPAYFSDFFDFVRESRMEDLPQESGGKGLVVTVSTIHKAKGREFDNVWLLVKNKDSALDNEKRRLIYVGMTRAKNVLHIFTDVPAIAAAAQSAAREGVKTVRNDEASPPPEEIMLSLQHEDVVLDCFRNRKQQIFKMHCGQKLAFFPGGMTAEADGRRETAAVYSRKFKEEKLGKWLAQGYEPAEAHVQYIAAWKSTDDGETHAVLLPRMVLRKRQEPQASQ